MLVKISVIKFPTKKKAGFNDSYVYVQNKRAHIVDHSFQATAILSKLG